MQGFARVVLVGHSYGCYLVNKLVTEQPDRVTALVLIGAGYPTPGFARMRWIFHLPTMVSALPCCYAPSMPYLSNWTCAMCGRLVLNPSHAGYAILQAETAFIACLTQ